MENWAVTGKTAFLLITVTMTSNSDNWNVQTIQWSDGDVNCFQMFFFVHRSIIDLAWLFLFPFLLHTKFHGKVFSVLSCNFWTSFEICVYSGSSYEFNWFERLLTTINHPATWNKKSLLTCYMIINTYSKPPKRNL